MKKEIKEQKKMKALKNYIASAKPRTYSLQDIVDYLVIGDMPEFLFVYNDTLFKVVKCTDLK